MSPGCFRFPNLLPPVFLRHPRPLVEDILEELEKYSYDEDGDSEYDETEDDDERECSFHSVYESNNDNLSLDTSTVALEGELDDEEEEDDEDTLSCSYSSSSGESNTLEDINEAFGKQIKVSTSSSLRGMKEIWKEGAPRTFLSPGFAELFHNNRGQVIDFSQIDLQKDPLFVKGMADCIQRSNPLLSVTHDNNDGDNKDGDPADDHNEVTSPKDIVEEILLDLGGTFRPLTYRKFQNTQNAFLKVTNDMIFAYNSTLMTAIRYNDVDALRQLFKMGYNLQCCNKFGESILHTVARLGRYDCLFFFVHEAKLSLRVVCDTGRTPLHDACWATEPNFDCIRLILKECPDFLYVADERSLTPLSYVPKEAWRKWSDFLETNSNLVQLFTVLRS